MTSDVFPTLERKYRFHLSLSRWRIPTMVKQKWRESEEIWLSNKALRLKWLLLSVECGVVWGDGFCFGRHRFSNYCVCLWSMWQKPKLLAHANLCIQQNSLLTTWIWHARKCIITTGCVMLCYWSCFRQSHIFKVCLSLSLSLPCRAVHAMGGGSLFGGSCFGNLPHCHVPVRCCAEWLAHGRRGKRQIYSFASLRTWWVGWPERDSSTCTIKQLKKRMKSSSCKLKSP